VVQRDQRADRRLRITSRQNADDLAPGREVRARDPTHVPLQLEADEVAELDETTQPRL
jgi:hypothetical protein